MPKRESLDDRIAALSQHWDLVRPEGAGPYPLVIQLPGCGGKKPFQQTWAEVAAANGAAALVVDSHAHRGISQLGAYSTVCSGLRLRGAERAGDLIAAFVWAQRQDWVDSSRIYAAGWSHGGWTILDALCVGDKIERFTGLQDAPLNALDDLKGAFIVYPYAGVGCLTHLRPAAIKPAITGIVCGADTIVGAQTPLRVFERLKAQGLNVNITLFENGTHAFDEPYARDIRVRPDAVLVARAHALYTDFLTQDPAPA
jgi:dienelactone hydrolase